ncbi:MAG: SLC13 family permease, partial [Desulfonatronovibrio sp.]
MEATTLNTEIILVLFMIGLAIFLFVMEWIRVDMVAILMTVSLPLLGLVTPKEAFSGFSSNAVISIIAVIIIGAGLDKTGLINRIVNPILKLAGNSSSRVIVFMGATVAIISSFMQNIGAAALFLPAIKRVSKSLNISLSQLLMPIGFCAIM